MSLTGRTEGEYPSAQRDGIAVTLRARVLTMALLVTLGGAAWLAMMPDADAPVQALQGRHGVHAGAAAVAQVVSTEAEPRPSLERGPWPQPTPDAVLAWSGPPAAAPAASTPRPSAAPPLSPPARPQPPPFQYQLIGSLREGEHLRALLDSPQRSLVVGAGDLVDGQWRVDKVTATGVDLLWLPQGVALTLRYRSS